jgi:hypothetical protein
MLSTEKARDALDKAEAVADREDAPPRARMAASILTLGRGHLEALIPENPDELDDILVKGAGWLLSLRSDGASLLGLIDEGPPAGEEPWRTPTGEPVDPGRPICPQDD